MRTVTRLHPRIVAPGNVAEAYREAARGKRRRPDVAAFALRAEEALADLQRELAEDRWRPRGYSVHVVREPKARLIAAAPFRDRVVHHAVHRVLAPCLIRRFTADTFACLPDRGTHRAVLRFRGELRRNAWLARLDVQRYFLEIDWDILLAVVGRTVRDRPLLGLLERILGSGAGLYTDPAVLAALGVSGRYVPAPRKGLPIGALTSQLFANVYLDGLDHFAKRELKVPGYLRYMDDVVLFGRTAVEVRAAAAACAAWLREARALAVHPGCGRAIPAAQTHRFLGHVVSRQGCRVHGRTVRRLVARTMAGVRAAEDARALVELEARLHAEVRSLAV
jgi:hypothetical protein